MHYNQGKGIEASSRLTQEAAIRGIIQGNSTVYVRRAIIYLGCGRVGMRLLVRSLHGLWLLVLGSGHNSKVLGSS
jgi:hypothetical protein